MTLSVAPLPIRRHCITWVVLILCSTLTAACAQSAGDSAGAKKAPRLNTVVDAKPLKALRRASQSGLTHSVQPAKSPLKPISGPPVTAGLKPGVLYMGADFCPYCASLRWPLVLSLQRFGQFKDLKYMRSGGNDVYPDTITFSFHGAGYKSQYLTFQSVELSDREGRRLETPDPQQKALFRKFDTPPYTSSPGGIPFLYIGGRYIESGAPFSPGVLKNMSWSEATGKLKNTKTAFARKVMGATNLYTAAICKLTKGIPARVCATQTVKTAAADLPDASP